MDQNSPCTSKRLVKIRSFQPTASFVAMLYAQVQLMRSDYLGRMRRVVDSPALVTHFIVQYGYDTYALVRRFGSMDGCRSPFFRHIS